MTLTRFLERKELCRAERGGQARVAESTAHADALLPVCRLLGDDAGLAFPLTRADRIQKRALLDFVF
jgi:hypothetical protein